MAIHKRERVTEHMAVIIERLTYLSPTEEEDGKHKANRPSRDTG